MERLRVLPGPFVIEHVQGSRIGDDDWVALVRVSCGLTVVRSARDAGEERSVAFYGDDTAHDLDVPGMLAALVGPLAAAAVPVFVTSTVQADLIFVPETHLDSATSALRAAGHEVTP
jgi:hypothetical protein